MRFPRDIPRDVPRDVPRLISWRFTVAFTALLMGLKLSGYVSWAWLWVLGPLWLPTALLVVLVLTMVLGLGAARIMRNWNYLLYRGLR